jgi:hypothetical protein
MLRRAARLLRVLQTARGRRLPKMHLKCKLRWE